jgi:uncharacterized membrane protein YdfJ with MMPL/SSD domain
MAERFSNFISRHWLAVLVTWVVVALALHRVAPRWDDVTYDGDLAYLPSTLPSVEAELLLARAFPDNLSKSEVAILVERPGGKLTSDDLVWSDALSASFEPLANELGIVDHWDRNTGWWGQN